MSSITKRRSHGLSWHGLWNWTKHSGAPSFRTASLRDGADFICLCWDSGLHFAAKVELVFRIWWSGLNTGNYFLCGGSNEHRFRYGQHPELGHDRRDQHRHFARNVRLHISEWFNEREPDGNDNLHVDCYQCGRLKYVYAYRYSNDGK
jgi:hypothetical protein